MRYLYITFFLALCFACQKETLDTVNKPKVMLLQIDYKTFTFEGAKEFSYFNGDDNDQVLPVQLNALLPNPMGDFSVIYSTDTIFKGVQVNQGKGYRIYPDSMDDQIHYLTVENDVVMPNESSFKLLNDDLSATDVDLTKIWKAVSKLRTLNRYRNSNSNAEIGLFLFRPSFSNNNSGDWKWYLIIKN